MIQVPIDTASDIGDAIREIIDAAPDGAELVLASRPEPYVAASPIVVGERPVRIRGGGPWKTVGWGPPGWDGWRLPSQTQGAVIHCPGIVQDGPYCRGFELQDVCLIGDGKGVGLHFTPNPTGSTRVRTRNVGVLNFVVGMQLENTLSGTHDGLFVRGCGIGLNIVRDVTDTTFRDINLESCALAGLFQSGSSIKFRDGLVQSNGRGFLFQPIAGEQLTKYTFDGLWFEGNQGGTLEFDATYGIIEATTFRDCQDGQECTVPITIPNPKKFPIVRTAFEGCPFRGCALIGKPGFWLTDVGPVSVFARIKGVDGVRAQEGGSWQ